MACAIFTLSKASGSCCDVLGALNSPWLFMSSFLVSDRSPNLYLIRFSIALPGLDGRLVSPKQPNQRQQGQRKSCTRIHLGQSLAPGKRLRQRHERRRISSPPTPSEGRLSDSMHRARTANFPLPLPPFLC